MKRPSPAAPRLLPCLASLLLLSLAAGPCWSEAPAAPSSSVPPDLHRSPVDVAVSEDQSWLVSANQTSDSVSLIRWPAGELTDEAAVGDKPAYIALWKQQRFLVSCNHGRRLDKLQVVGGRLQVEGSIPLPGRPVGIAVDRQRDRAYVALESRGEVAEVDLATDSVVRSLSTGRWPRFLALSPDGRRLGVSTSGDRGVSVIDTRSGETIHQQSFVGLNIGHLHFAQDGMVYFPWMVYRRNPITPGNIRLGWVLASRIGRYRLDRDERREAVSLDPPGKAIADPFGLRVSSDGQTMVVSASGTHELLIYDVGSLPFEAFGGPDHLAPELRDDATKFDRVELGGRPMGLRTLRDDNTVLVANYLLDALQVVDVRQRKVVRTIELGAPQELSLVRRGEAIFYDGRRSLDQWYSCHSCHQDGGPNAVAMDTFNDDSARTFKTVLPLYHVTDTAPWTWHGWQTDLRAAMKKSITSTMQGEAPSESDVDAMIAYLKTVEPPPAPAAGEHRDAVRRGEQVFAKAGCADCHNGPRFTDGKVHDVGLGSRSDRYQGFNTPTLLGVGQRVKLLHDGRAKSIREALEGDHNPADVTGQTLTPAELDDLLEFLRTL